MQIPDLKQVDKLIALCRRRGVEKVRVGDLEITLGEAPQKKRTSGIEISEGPDEVTEDDYPLELTDDQKMFYSSDTQPPETKEP